LQESWNHNLHYHRLIIDVIAPDCQRSLDVGCGQGALTRRLRPLVPDVAGMDREERSIAVAALAERRASQGQDLGTVIGEQEALRDRRVQRGGEPGQVVSRTSGIAEAQFVGADRHGGAE